MAVKAASGHRSMSSTVAFAVIGVHPRCVCITSIVPRCSEVTGAHSLRMHNLHRATNSEAHWCSLSASASPPPCHELRLIGDSLTGAHSLRLHHLHRATNSEAHWCSLVHTLSVCLSQISQLHHNRHRHSTLATLLVDNVLAARSTRNATERAGQRGVSRTCTTNEKHLAASVRQERFVPGAHTNLWRKF
jgi:hypothetical protein